MADPRKIKKLNDQLDVESSTSSRRRSVPEREKAAQKLRQSLSAEKQRFENDALEFLDSLQLLFDFLYEASDSMALDTLEDRQSSDVGELAELFFKMHEFAGGNSPLLNAVEPYQETINRALRYAREVYIVNDDYEWDRKTNLIEDSPGLLQALWDIINLVDRIPPEDVEDNKASNVTQKGSSAMAEAVQIPLTPLKERFGAAVTAAREAKGWSKAKAARATEMSPNEYANLENGTGNPTLATIAKVEEALDIRLL